MPLDETWQPLASTGTIDENEVPAMVVRIQGEEFYSAQEACEVLGVKLATLYSYVNRGLITSYRQGIRRQRLYLRSAIDSLLDVTPASTEEARDAIPPAETWTNEH